MLIGLLTFVLVVDCLLLILLVLMQLPKKEAGAGMAFGGGATDALFGAGTGNALTKLTKYAAGVFLGLALILSVLNVKKRNESPERIKELLQKGGAAPTATVPAATTPASSAQKTVPAGVTPAPAQTAPPATAPVAPVPATPAAPAAPAAPPAPAPEKK